MSKLNSLKAALAVAIKEGAVAKETGTAKWDDTLDFAYAAIPVTEHLVQCAEFLVDALPGIEAYANSLGNENYRSMWLNQIAKYKQTLGELGLSSAQAADRRGVAGVQNGWFDVDAWKTRECWEGPDAADDGLDGFVTLEAAKEYANSPEFAGYYQVSVVALGEHAEFEPGERVYFRFDRSESA